MKRVIVIGTTGSGKSTMATNVAALIDAPVIELDRFLWMPGWQQRDNQEYLRLLENALHTEKWVIDGNTRRNRPLVWGEADTLIWLNYGFFVNYSRLLWRTIKRVIKKEEVLPGCVETFRSQFLSSDSLLVWFFKTFWKRKKDYRNALKQEEYQHLTVLEFRQPQQANRFLQHLRDSYQVTE